MTSYSFKNSLNSLTLALKNLAALWAKAFYSCFKGYNSGVAPDVKFRKLR